MYKVYILISLKDRSLYTGMTTDLKQRLTDHNSGSSKCSQNKRPMKLVWYCAFKEKKKALSFESYLKHGSGFAFARKHFV